MPHFLTYSLLKVKKFKVTMLDVLSPDDDMKPNIQRRFLAH